MDYMKEERERGITIRSACISFSWNEHQINLIDTPGHIDFNLEVERSLRVLDGAILIIDGVNGVETQSETVWKQANKFGVPRLVFVNKMDRIGSNFNKSLEGIEEKLNAKALPLQMPLIQSESLRAVVDLVEMKKITWKDDQGNVVEIEELSPGSDIHKTATEMRASLLGSLADFDDTIANLFLLEQPVVAADLRAAVRRALSAHPDKLCFAFAGSALKNRGVQPLLDAIVSYLPSPREKSTYRIFDPSSPDSPSKQLPADANRLVAFVFKIVHDPRHGPLAYAKVYSGELKSRSTLFNNNVSCEEKASQILRMRAGENQEVKSVSVGDIAAITGLKETSSGHTLVGQKGELSGWVLEAVTVPKPVFMSSLTLADDKHKQRILTALSHLNREDPSFSFEEDPDTSQLVVKGYGELHLEIMKDRLKSEYGFETSLAKLRVALKESVRGGASESKTMEKKLRDGNKYFQVAIETDTIDPAEIVEVKDEKIEIKQNCFTIFLEEGNVLELAFFTSDMAMSFYREFREAKRGSDSEKLKLRNPTDSGTPKSITLGDQPELAFHISAMSFELIYAMESVLKASFARGPLMCKHLINTKIRVTDGQFTKGKTNETIVSMCTNAAIIDCLNNSSVALMEPMMTIEINCPESCSQEVINDLLSKRGGSVMDVSSVMTDKKSQDNIRCTIKGTVPLHQTIGYSTFLRTVSSVSFKPYVG